MQHNISDIIECLKAARKLLAHGFSPHFTKAVEVVGDEVRHVMYAGPKFHPEVHEWAVDDAILEAANRNHDLALATEEYLRPLTAPVFSIIEYSMKDGCTQKDILFMFDKAIGKALTTMKTGRNTFDVVKATVTS